MKRLPLVALSLALCFSAARAAEPAAATKPAARAVTKISAPLAPDSKETVAVLLDVNDAPEWKEWGVKAGNYALKWYPELARQLAEKDFVPPREFTIVIKKD